MLSRSQNFLLQCLSDHLNGAMTEGSGTGINLAEVFSLAAAHSVEGILFYQCRTIMPDEIKRKHLKEYLGNAVISIRREKMIGELRGQLERRNIPVIFMKGAVFREDYPVPALRSMGDVDLVIKPDDRSEMDLILCTEMGYNKFVDNQAVWTYWKDNFYIEVHDHMFYENLSNNTDYREYFDHIWEHCHRAPIFGVESNCFYVPDDEFHFLYLMAHTAKHIVNNGSGFRAYMDISVIRKAKPEMDWQVIEREMDKLSLGVFMKTCMTLCERWFGIGMPFRLENPDEDFLESVTEKTFKDGIFGLENEENQEAKAAKEIKRSVGPYYVGAVKRVFVMIFPPYEDMQLIPWYSFVDGRPWLLPVAWVYRWFYCIGRKAKHGWNLLTEPFFRQAEVKKRQAYLVKWGL